VAKADEAKENLAAAALLATAPDPKRWVQGWQMGLAMAVLVGAFALAGYLTLHGPPAPKAATTQLTETKENGTESTETTTATAVVGAAARTAGSSTTPTDPSSVAAAGGSGESSEEGESLANLSKQGPWAFTIVALLAAVFLATGKTLNVGGSKTDPATDTPDDAVPSPAS
jgi:cobalamin biosynthesis Mg chelatase CobN